MADTGTKYPATISTVQEVGDDNDWVTPGEVVSDNGVYGEITAASFDLNDTSYLLKATNPSMGVPAGATINGILVEIERHYEAGTVADYDVCLTKDGSARVGDDKSTGATFPTADAITSFGGATDLWGTTWTVDEINATTFGVLYKMQATANNADGFVDFIRITVYYTATVAQSVGGASAAIAGSIIKKTAKTMGGASMTIAGVLATAKKTLKAVGEASMTIAGTLTTIRTKVLSVGGAAMSIAGALSKLTSKAMGQASITIIGSLTTQFTAGSQTIAQAVGDGVVAISHALGIVFDLVYRHEYNRFRVLFWRDKEQKEKREC